MKRQEEESRRLAPDPHQEHVHTLKILQLDRRSRAALVPPARPRRECAVPKDTQ